MQLVDSLRKKKLGDGGLCFCNAAERTREFLEKYPAGKALFVTDGSAAGAFRGIPYHRAVGAVLEEGDALPLFAMPDSIALVLAAGRRDTLAAARYFAQIRRVPVLLFPSSPDLCGAYEREATLSVGGVRARVTLADGEIACDLSLTRGRVSEGYERLLVARLALLEARALRAFGCGGGNEAAEERAYAVLSDLTGEPTPQEIVKKNVVLAECAEEGMSLGEGETLAACLGRDGRWRAFLQLSSLYAAFFGKGKPIPFVPDYRERARAAGASYAEQILPTPEEYAFRVCALERKRALFCAEAETLVRGTDVYRKNLYALSGRVYGGAGDLEELKKLPERTHGLCAVIRDFGLMDW